ncbi:MAG: hypothetical protein ACTSR8_10385 [Promethearchaeota archaeon]
MQSFSLNRLLWFLIGVLTLITSLFGIFYHKMYTYFVDNNILSGILSQDIVSFGVSCGLIVLTFKLKQEELKKHIIILGLLGYLFYGYGIYVIEQIYTILYFLYLLIFGLSFYSILFTLNYVNNKRIQNIQIPNLLRLTSALFLLACPIIFIPLWIGKLLLSIEAHQKVEYFSAIYILDLCFIMPLFIITAFMMIKNQELGLFLAPVLFLKTTALLFSVALGGLLISFYGQTVEIGISLFRLLILL